ncbi:MAG TPA: winged helix-turn-helix domain-containing protein [Burkholderiales bacterium]|nr:winged helix-turn-helix domain-containing protein [Burkholderiales bacterium]
MPDDAQQAPHALLTIGDWTVEPPLNQLSSDERVVKIEPKAMALLCHLAERPGEVVSREALLSAVWPGVVVSDDALTQVVIKLRKALGDDAEAPAYIQTIPKRGYRLVAKVARPAASTPPAPARKSPWPAVAAVASIAAAGAIGWIALRPDDTERIGRAVTSGEAARAAQPTVGIRAFEAVGGDAEAAVLARGITADLATDLSKISGISVVAESAAGMAARYVVTGSVQRAGERLRLNVHLTDAASGKQLWSERYDRTLSDLFAVQEELGRAVVQLLPAKVSEAELARVARPHTRNLEAYRYFQRGQLAAIARQRTENETARELFRRAIELDPRFARAYAALAMTYAIEHRNQWSADSAAALQRAYELATTARQIDSDVPETYLALALVNLQRRRHREALEQAETAVRLYPSYSDAYALMGGILTYMDQPREAPSLLRIAMRLNPDGSYLHSLILGRAHYGLDNAEQAKLNLGYALQRNPADVEARVYMAASQLAGGDNAAAAWEADEIRTLAPGFSARTWLSTHPLVEGKTRQKLAKALSALGLD